jgi:ubiquinone/menaquinone biosynthesis C-methylase UbiE
MDEAPPADTEKSLSDIARINRYLGGRSILRSTVERLNLPENARCLDVGAASGDLGRVVKSIQPQAQIVSADIHVHHLTTNPFLRLGGDGFRLPFRSATFDLVYCSLFLHHFSNSDVIWLLAEFNRVSRFAVVAVDLHRNPLAVRFLPQTQWLFGWHPMTVYDGSASVASSFRGQELVSFAEQAGLQRPVQKLHLPWMRWSLVGYHR